MIIVELDAIIEFGHHIVCETVQGLYIARILLVGDAAVSLKTGWKLISTKRWTRVAGHATRTKSTIQLYVWKQRENVSELN